MEALRQLILPGLNGRVGDMEDLLADPDRFAERVRAALKSGNPATRRRMTRALRPVIISVLAESGDGPGEEQAMSPLIGKAVTAAVLMAFNNRMATLGEALTRSFSWEGLKWRWQAFRTGQTFTDVVAQHTAYFKVTDAFLIARKSGLVMVHAHSADSPQSSEQVTAAYLTAIQDYAQEMLFDDDTEGQLASLRFADHTIFLEGGNTAYVAAVVHGQPPVEKIVGILQDCIETYHTVHHEPMLAYATNANALLDHREPLEACLVQEGVPRESRETPRWFKAAMWGAVLLPFLLFAAFKIKGAMAAAEERGARQDLHASMIDRGVDVLSEPGDKVWYFTLNDFKCDTDPGTLRRLVTDAGFDRQSLRLVEQPEDGRLVRTLSDRINYCSGHRYIGVDVNAEGKLMVKVDRDRLVPLVDPRQLEADLGLDPGQIILLPVFREFDDAELNDKRLEKQLRSGLSIPEGVTTFAVTEGVLVVGGEAGHDWRSSLVTLPARYDGLRSVDTSQLVMWDADWHAYINRLADSGSFVIEHAECVSSGGVIRGVRKRLNPNPKDLQAGLDGLQRIGLTEEWAYDLDGLYEWLQPPPTISLSHQANRLVVKGVAEKAWLEAALSKLSELRPVPDWRVSDPPLPSSFPLAAFKKLVAQVNGSADMALLDPRQEGADLVSFTFVRAPDAPALDALLRKAGVGAKFVRAAEIVDERHVGLIRKRLRAKLKGIPFELEDVPGGKKVKINDPTYRLEDQGPFIMIPGVRGVDVVP